MLEVIEDLYMKFAAAPEVSQAPNLLIDQNLATCSSWSPCWWRAARPAAPSWRWPSTLPGPSTRSRKTRDDLVKMIEGARRKGFGEPDSDGGNDVADDVMNMPPKAMPDLGIWNAGRMTIRFRPAAGCSSTIFCRRFLSSLIADGGVGKTAVRMVQLISLATGRALSGEHVFAAAGC